MLLGQALMLLILPLLEFLPILFLLREYFFLLLLIFPIHFWVARIRSAGPIRRRKVARMDGSTNVVISRTIVRPVAVRPIIIRRTLIWVFWTRSRRIVPRLISRTICAAIIRGRITRPWRFRRHNCRVVKYSRLRCRCDRRLSHIRGSPLLRIASRRLRMLSLNRDRGKVSLTRYSLLLRSRTRVDPAIAAVVADVVHVVVDYRCVVNVVDLSNVHIVHRTVIEEASVLPTSAFITLTEKIGRAHV